jgi:hypothetical protein
MRIAENATSVNRLFTGTALHTTYMSSLPRIVPRILDTTV